MNKTPWQSTIIAGILTLVGTVGAQEAGQDPRAAISMDNVRVRMRSDFQRFRQRAKSGELTRVVTFGGSITEAAHGHSAQVPAWLKQHFPKADFQFSNAGISSTCSTSGAFRLERDVLAGGRVDLLIVEFAVNDDQDAGHAERECIRGMEGIVRHLRQAQPQADILMVQYVNPEMLDVLLAGKIPLSLASHEKVADHYGIPSVNVATEVASAVKEGRYTWEDYGGTHPKPFGYQVAVNMMVSALERGMAADDTDSGGHPLPPPLESGNYAGGVWVDVQDAAWLGGWKYGKVGKNLLPVGAIRPRFEEYEVLRGDEAGTTLYLDFEGRAVGAFVLAGPDAGMLEVSVDGSPWQEKTLYHQHSGKLNYPRSVMFATDLPTGRHQLALRLGEKKPQGSEGTAASILSFEVNR